MQILHKQKFYEFKPAKTSFHVFEGIYYPLMNIHRKFIIYSCDGNILKERQVAMLSRTLDTA